MNGLWRRFREIMHQTAFRAAFIVLVLAAVGLNAATQYFKLHFHKLPVPLVMDLEKLPEDFGKWVCVSKDESLNDSLIEELGTRQFIFRDYVNSSLVPRAEIDKFQGLSLPGRQELLAALRANYPTGVLRCAVTYYTGKADTVAHIPERCYVASGFELTSWQEVTWDVNSKLTPDGQVKVRFTSFEDQGASANTIPTNVVYFFQTDGHYECDTAKVRLAMQNLWKPYAYYAKVEVALDHSDPNAAAGAMRDFLGDALPQIERALPTRKTLAELNKGQ